MTPKEAIIQIRSNDCPSFCEGDDILVCSECRWGLAVESLEKQVPVIGSRLDHWTGICPSCKMPVPSTGKFCHECGQALDWEVTK